MHCRYPSTLVALAASVAWGCGGGGGAGGGTGPVVPTTPAAQRSVQRAGTITVDSFVAGPTSYSPNSSSFDFELPSNASEPGVAAGGAGESAGGNG